MDWKMNEGNPWTKGKKCGSGSVLRNYHSNCSHSGIGFDAISENYVDMLHAGIIDPVKVTKSALINAVSISSTLLTTEAAVAEIKEAAPTQQPMPDMGY